MNSLKNAIYDDDFFLKKEDLVNVEDYPELMLTVNLLNTTNDKLKNILQDGNKNEKITFEDYNNAFKYFFFHFFIFNNLLKTFIHYVYFIIKKKINTASINKNVKINKKKCILILITLFFIKIKNIFFFFMKYI